MNKYKMLFDYHTHTTFSHGKGSIEDNVKEAVKKGLEAIAITDHGPGHMTYGIKREDVPIMRAEIEKLKPLYPQIKIYLGVEANIIDTGNNLDVTAEEITQYDFILAGYHFGIRECYSAANFMYSHGIGTGKKRTAFLRERNTKMVVKAIEENDIKILTHPGDKAPVDMAKVAKACAKKGVLMELNMKHPHLTVDEIKIAAKEDVSFIISSDAHISEKVGTFEAALKRAMDAGIDLSRIVNIRKI